MSRGSISFNYSHFSSIYTSAARPFLCTKNLCSWEFTGENVFSFLCFFFPPSYTKSSVFTNLSQATTSHLVCCCIKLWHQPRPNCFQTRRGLSFHFIFRFLAQVSAAPRPAKADNEKRCMMSCRQTRQHQNLVTKFPGSYHFPLSFPSLSFPLLCLFFFAMGKSTFFFFSFFLLLIIFRCSICGNAPDKGVCVQLTCGCLFGLVPSVMCLTFLTLKQEERGKEGRAVKPKEKGGGGGW